MSDFTNRLYPGPIAMIRADHTHVMITSQQYDKDTHPSVKKGLVGTICAALEVHAELEEEIFYPAVAAAHDSPTLEKSVPEHMEMRELINRLKNMEPTDPDYDQVFHDLMQIVIHHVADEESVVLPDAQRYLSKERLDELGAQMTKRRIELTLPRSGEIAVNLARSMPRSTIALLTGGLVFGLWMIGRSSQRRSGYARLRRR